MIKLWQDKTEEEVKADIEKMLEEGKLTKWDPWDHIKTLEEAKDYVEAIYEEWFSESDAANDCIIEILESYMEFMDIAHKTLNRKDPEKYLSMFTLLVAKRRAQWEPVLTKAKEMQKARKSAKKSA